DVAEAVDGDGLANLRAAADVTVADDLAAGRQLGDEAAALEAVLEGVDQGEIAVRRARYRVRGRLPGDVGVAGRVHGDREAVLVGAAADGGGVDQLVIAR